MIGEIQISMLLEGFFTIYLSKGEDISHILNDSP